MEASMHLRELIERLTDFEARFGDIELELFVEVMDTDGYQIHIVAASNQHLLLSFRGWDMLPFVMGYIKNEDGVPLFHLKEWKRLHEIEHPDLELQREVQRFEEWKAGQS